jgi:hypothetical protein
MKFGMQDRYEWHRVFAWTPKPLEGTNYYVWLQFVYRRRSLNVGLGSEWIYQENPA